MDPKKPNNSEYRSKNRFVAEAHDIEPLGKIISSEHYELVTFQKTDLIDSDGSISRRSDKIDDAHHLHSSLREKIVEHVFVGEALRTLWRRGVFDAEVLRSEFDAYGYDLVMGRGRIVRHIQFKTGVRDRPGRVSIASALAEKPSGCVIWIQVDNALNMQRFWWFGGKPGEALPDLGERPVKRIGRTKDGIRPVRENHRLLTGSSFSVIQTLDGVLEALFGHLPRNKPPTLADNDEAAST